MSDVRLGDLEMAILDKVWQCSEPVQVGDILAMLQDRELAYTTVMTVMSNLHKKGLLERHRQGKSFLYSPTQSREQVGQSLLGRIRSVLFAGSQQSWLSCLLGSDQELTAAELTELKKRIREIEERESSGE